MIDKSNEVFTLVATELRKKFKGISVMGENIDTPKKFPTVTIDEVSNLPTHEDGKTLNQYARVRYRVQVFSNKENGKRAEARAIYKVVDEVLQSINLKCKAYNPLPSIYNSQIYQITSSYEGIFREDGQTYRT